MLNKVLNCADMCCIICEVASISTCFNLLGQSWAVEVEGEVKYECEVDASSLRVPLLWVWASQFVAEFEAERLACVCESDGSISAARFLEWVLSVYLDDEIVESNLSVDKKKVTLKMKKG